MISGTEALPVICRSAPPALTLLVVLEMRPAETALDVVRAITQPVFVHVFRASLGISARIR